MNIRIEQVDMGDQDAVARLAQALITCTGRVDRLQLAGKDWFLAYPSWNSGAIGVAHFAPGEGNDAAVDLAIHPLSHHFDAGHALLMHAIKHGRELGWSRLVVPTGRRGRTFLQQMYAAGFGLRWNATPAAGEPHATLFKDL